MNLVTLPLNIPNSNSHITFHPLSLFQIRVAVDDRTNMGKRSKISFKCRKLTKLQRCISFIH